MVTWGNKQFYIDGEPFEIRSGSIHYFRSFPQRWKELLQKLKDCGLNTVETYCCWNLHEPKPGVYDFSGRLDLVHFIELAQELGLYVVLRPGPYICAEWEFGGLPAWLLKDEGIRLRTDEGPYLDYVARFFGVLIPKIVPYLQTNGGNIILVAAENEYGSFGCSKQYMNVCVKLLKDRGVDVPIFTSDGETEMFLKGGRADDCLCGLDFGYTEGVIGEEQFGALDRLQPDAPRFHVEHWIGNFSHWGKPLSAYKPEFAALEVQRHLEEKASFNLYMFHGGTNFGFMNGANITPVTIGKPECNYLPDITSYDYDGVLTEWGEITPKYKLIQQAISRHTGVELPTPEPVPVMALGDVRLEESAELLPNVGAIGEKHISACPHGMEYYGQDYGYILYRTRICEKNPVRKLVIGDFADRVNIYFNGIYRGTMSRNDAVPLLEVDGWMDEGGVLDLLVENQGRINFGPRMDRGDRKGIMGHVYINPAWGPRQLLNNWEVYTLTMADLAKLSYTGATGKNVPTFYRGSFYAQERKESFIHLEHFTKGFVVVNGFNLGRFWNVGPQLSLYMPSQILKDYNEIVVFDEVGTDEPVVSIRDYTILDATVTEEKPITVV